MSPEAFGKGAVDHRTDIWSVGVTFFNLLTGKLPFDTELKLSVIKVAIQVETVDPFTELGGEDLLKQVGITKDIPPVTPIGALSGGERQSVAIARAMYFDSDLIILDEPTNNLGVAETQGVLRFVRNARESGHSCIFIAHNIHHVFQVVDRIVVLRHGGVAADDVYPNTTTIEQVERIITGVSD